MKKRVLSVLLALCLAGSLASTAWAAGDTAGATPSPAPVTQNLDENAGEPAELNENGEDLENTDLTDETLDDATDGAPDSDSTGVPEEGDTSDDSAAAGTSASDEEDSTSANEGDSTPAGDASSADGSTGAEDENTSTPTEEDIEGTDASDADQNKDAVSGPTTSSSNEIQKAPQKVMPTSNANGVDTLADYNNLDSVELKWGNNKSTLKAYLVNVDKNGTQVTSSLDNAVDISGTNGNIYAIANALGVDSEKFEFGWAILKPDAQQAVNDSNAKSHLTALSYYNFGWFRPDYAWGYKTDGGWKKVSDNGGKLYFVFKEIETGGNPGTDPDPGTPTTLEPAHNKYVKDNQNGTYNLTLDVTGEINSSEEDPTKIDILYIVDVSTSMGFGMGDGSGKSKLEAAVGAVNALENALKESPDSNHEKIGLDIKHSYVTFNGYGGNGNGAWVDFETSLGLDSLSLGAGTNYSVGMDKAKDRLNQVKNDGAIKVVIFISDGNPDWYESEAGDIKEAGETLRDEIRLGNNDYFYAIGVGSDVDADNLNTLVGYATVPKTHSGYHTNTTASTLVTIFENLAAELTDVDCSNVTITDTLNDLYVELADSATFTVNIKDDQTALGSASFSVDELNNAFANNEGSVSKTINVSYGDNKTEQVPVDLRYDARTKTYTLSFKKTDGTAYVLHDGWTYSITTTIQPTQAATDKYMADGYPDVGEADTGVTSEYQQGFFSNESASLTYTTSGEEKTLPYAKPVIQVDETYTPEPVDPDPDIRKYVANGDGNSYNLSLDVTGTYNKDEKPLNVLYILDESYSMMWTMNGDYPDKDISSPNNGGDDAYGPNPGGDNQYPEEGTNQNVPYEYSYVRVNAAKAAIKRLNKALDANGMDTQVALVTFANEREGAGQDDYHGKTISWENLDVEGFQNELTPSEWSSFASGTNYKQAFDAAETLLKNAPKGDNNEDVETVVIFITDGEPNWPQGGNALGAATDAVKNLDCDRFYAIGVGNEASIETLQRIVNAADQVKPENKGASSNANTADLLNYFNQIATEIAGAETKNVVITDTLSDYAELVDGSAVPTISITDEDNEKIVVTSPESLTQVAGDDGTVASYTGTYSFSDPNEKNPVQLTYTYTVATKTFTLTFPETYSLTKDWVYTITVSIQPSQKAFEDVAKGNGYTDKGEPNTDVPGTKEENYISTGKDGFFSNEDATLTYGEDGAKTYPKPVITVKSGSLTIQKSVNSEVEGLVNGETYEFIVTKVDSSGIVDEEFNGTYKISDEVNVIFEDGVSDKITVTGANSVTISGLPNGFYKVEEDTNDIQDVGNNDEYYFFDESYAGENGTNNVTEAEGSDSATATVSAGLNTKVIVTNTYKLYRTVKIEKMVDGEMGATTVPFNFTTSITRDTVSNVAIKAEETIVGTDTVKAKLYGNNVLENDKAKFTSTGYTLADSEYITITKLKDGDELTIVEAEANSNGYETSYIIGSTTQENWTGTVTVNGDMEITIKNYRKVVAPTGLESNHTAPYTILVTMAGIAGLALIGGMVARRVRRRREE